MDISIYVGLEKRRKAKLKPQLIDLPDDVIVNIIMRLPTKSICCIRCASKTFSGIVDSPLFVTLHMSRLLNFGINPVGDVVEVPQLMLYSRPWTTGYSEIHLQSLKYNGEYDLKKIDHNLHISKLLFNAVYNVDTVFCNLFFFKRALPYGGPYFLIDPLRGEVLKIPAKESGSRRYKFPRDWYGMGFDDTTNTHKLVCVTTSINYPVVSQVIALGQSSSSCSWREIQAVPPCELSERKVCAYGDMHWLVEEGGCTDNNNGGGISHIISFDFKKEEFCWTCHPTLRVCDVLILKYCHLINFKGSMAIVDTSARDYVEIWVMKNYVKKEWSRDYKTNIQIFVQHPYVLQKYTCGEWNKGIFFVQDNGNAVHYRPSVCYFLNLQSNLMKRVKNAWSGYEKNIFNYSGSLISLKSYGNLVQPIRTNVWHFT